MRIYLAGQRVLANCGTRAEPDWIPGVVVSREIAERPCYVKFDEPCDGKDGWYFADSALMEDNRRNRKRHGLGAGT